MARRWSYTRPGVILAALSLASAVGAAAPEVAPIAPAAPAAPAANVKALRDEATKLFKQKKYAAACERFQAAVAAAPDDAGLLTDLALCQQKLGKDAEAIASNQRAIGIASRDDKLIADPAAARVRRHAYFNLNKLGVDVAPGLSDGACGELDALPGCAKAFHACAYTATQGWAVRMYDRRTLKLALTAKEAVWTEDERTEHAFDEPSSGQASDPPGRVEGWLSVITSFEEEARTHTCEWNGGWTCERSAAVEAAARACLVAAGTPAKPGAPVADTACFKTACAALKKKPSKAVVRERREADKDVSRCESDIEANTGGSYSCEIVYANACTGLLATACGDDESPRNRKPAIEIDEYRLVPGK